MATGSRENLSPALIYHHRSTSAEALPSVAVGNTDGAAASQADPEYLKTYAFTQGMFRLVSPPCNVLIVPQGRGCTAVSCGSNAANGMAGMMDKPIVESITWYALPFSPP